MLFSHQNYKWSTESWGLWQMGKYLWKLRKSQKHFFFNLVRKFETSHVGGAKCWTTPISQSTLHKKIKESDTTERLNWTELIHTLCTIMMLVQSCVSIFCNSGSSRMQGGVGMPAHLRLHVGKDKQTEQVVPTMLKKLWLGVTKGFTLRNRPTS